MHASPTGRGTTTPVPRGFGPSTRRTALRTALALVVLGGAAVARADTLYLDAGDTVSGLGPGDTVIYTDDSAASFTVAADGAHIPVDGSSAAAAGVPGVARSEGSSPADDGQRRAMERRGMAGVGSLGVVDGWSYFPGAGTW